MDTKTLKYKYIYGGNLTIRELLQLVQEGDVSLGNMAIVDVLTRLDALESENIRLKMELTDLHDTGSPVISVQDLPIDFKAELVKKISEGKLQISWLNLDLLYPAIEG